MLIDVTVNINWFCWLLVLTSMLTIHLSELDYIDKLIKLEFAVKFHLGFPALPILIIALSVSG